jgi:hypothetical protein
VLVVGGDGDRCRRVAEQYVGHFCNLHMSIGY